MGSKNVRRQSHIKSRYFDREMSMVEFNARVLSEGLLKTNPLLERLKFLCIVSSNLDEFFMVRVASLKKLIRSGVEGKTPSGLTYAQLFSKIAKRVADLVSDQSACLKEEILPGLASENIVLVQWGSAHARQIDYLDDFFFANIFPILSPVRFGEDGRFPSIANLRLHVLFRLLPVVDTKESSEQLRLLTRASSHLVILPIPHNLDRIVWMPDEEGRACYCLLEDIIINRAAHLFHGFEIKEYLLFRVTRDADLSVDEKKDEDYIEAMEEVLANRQYSVPVRLEICGPHGELRETLMNRLHLGDEDVYQIPGPFILSDFFSLASLQGKDELRYKEWPPLQSSYFSPSGRIWDVLNRGDILLHHPYDSFEPVVQLISEAAEDEHVLAIKMTLYRTSGDSILVQALLRATELGKQVTVLVELKARFDEERNIGWAQQLEKAGAIVIYGVADVKVHAKALLIIRKESQGIRRYVHLSTGNYNDRTAKLYTDIGLMSADDTLTYETALFFNVITGYSAVPTLNKLVLAPLSLKDKILRLIERERKKHSPDSPGHIMAKMNSLTDLDVIDALYQASQIGVHIELNVRGMCMLVPGVNDLSENIQVVSIIDRFLEHSRVFYFHNGGNEEVYLSSADWMPRNLERRIELMFPVENESLRTRLVETLRLFFADNTKAHYLKSDGTYKRKRPGAHEQRLHCQKELYRVTKQHMRSLNTEAKREFAVRRKPPRD